jgi:hypothetical protein
VIKRRRLDRQAPSTKFRAGAWCVVQQHRMLADARARTGLVLRWGGGVWPTGCVRESNLFTLLSAYRPGSAATPLKLLHLGLGVLSVAGTEDADVPVWAGGGAGTESLALVEVQAPVAGAGLADMVLTFEAGGRDRGGAGGGGGGRGGLPALTEAGDGLTGIRRSCSWGLAASRRLAGRR